MPLVLSIDTIVRDIVRARTSPAVPTEDLTADATLGSDGLGLDSISIAEVLLDCQQRFGVNVVALLEGEPLTLGKLVQHLEQETAA